MSQPTNQEYVLKDYADFMALSPEQFERMLPDFLSWKKASTQIEEGLHLAAKMLGVAPEEVGEMPNHFLLIDDGVTGEGTVVVKIKESLDGAVIATNQIHVGKTK